MHWKETFAIKFGSHVINEKLLSFVSILITCKISVIMINANIDLHCHTLEVISTMRQKAEGCIKNVEKMSRNPDLSLSTGFPWLPGARVLRCFECWRTRRGVRRAINLSICQFNPPAGRNSEQKNPRAAHKGKNVSFITRERREFHCALIHFISFDLISCLISVDLSVKLKYLWERSVKSVDGENFFFFENLYLRERKTHVIHLRQSNLALL